MKIAVLITHWKNTQGTGVTRYIINLIEELKKNPDLEIFILYRWGCDIRNYKINGTKYTFPFKAIPLLNKLQPDVVYIDTNWYFLLTGVMFKKAKGAKLITTIHSHPSKLPFFGKIVMQHLLNSCDIITYVSKDLQKTIHQIWDIQIRAREELTYSGVRPQFVSDEETSEFIRKYKIPENSFILLMQSSPIAKVKADGTKILMESVRELLHIYPEILLILTGTGPYLDELEEYAVTLNIQNKVIFTRWVENPFIPLKICDIYTHITLGEGGVSLAILEAMCAGKPIIASNIGGIPEAVENGKSGILIEPNVKTVTEAITKLLCDTELRTDLGNTARIRAKYFSWKTCADTFLKLFK